MASHAGAQGSIRADEGRRDSQIIPSAPLPLPMTSAYDILRDDSTDFALIWGRMKWTSVALNS